MNKILAAVDFSDLSTQVIEYASEQAKAFGCEVLVIHVEPPAPAFIGNEMSPPILTEQLTEEVVRIQDDLKAMVGYLNQKGIAASHEYLKGSVVDTIVDRAAEWNADLIVMGAHSHGILYRAFIGSISTGVLKASPCPVLVIPEKEK